MDDYEVPYVIDHIGEKIIIKNKTTCSLYLRVADNIDYLSIISAKKKLMKDWIEKHPIRAKKKAKRKKSMDYNFDE